MRAELQTDITLKTLVTAIDRQGVLFLVPVRLPGADGRIDPWNRSLGEAITRSADRWVKISANMTLGAYEVFEATGNFSEPVWPDISFQEILRIAFKDRYIDSLEHPVVRRLRGAL